MKGIGEWEKIDSSTLRRKVWGGLLICYDPAIKQMEIKGWS